MRMGPVTKESLCEHLPPRMTEADHGMIVLLGLSLGPQGFRYSPLVFAPAGRCGEGSVLLWDALATERSRGDKQIAGERER